MHASPPYERPHPSRHEKSAARHGARLGRLAVVTGGQIAELGTHEELLRANGRYAQLFELQAAGYR